MKKSKFLFYLLLGLVVFSCLESDRVDIIETQPAIFALEGLFIQLDSPSTQCDWMFESNSERYGFGQEVEDFFQVKSILYDTQQVVVRYDSIYSSDACSNFDMLISNLEIYEQKPLTNDISLLDVQVQFAAWMDTVYVFNDYLVVEYTASGCDRYTWDVALVDTGEISDASPPQRELVFWFSNRGGCALDTRQKAIFNIQELQLPGDQILLNVSNTRSESRSVIYSY